MGKINNFNRSQNAHKRLMTKYHKSNNDYDSFVKSNYHSAVIQKQRQSKRILSYVEKRAIYRDCEYYFYNWCSYLTKYNKGKRKYNLWQKWLKEKRTN